MMPPDMRWTKQKHAPWWDEDEAVWVCPVCPFTTESDEDAAWHYSYGRDPE